jgi:SlyX protein
MTEPDRIAAVEEKVAFLERAIAELSDVLVRQQRELDVAQGRTERLLAQLQSLAEDSGASATAFEKPPHY